MPLSRPRFTIGRLMVAVAVSALVTWVCVHYAKADPFEKILLWEIGGVLIIFGMMIGVCVSVAALLSRSSSPPR